MFGGIASLVLSYAAIAGVFGYIWIVSDWAFWALSKLIAGIGNFDFLAPKR